MILMGFILTIIFIPYKIEQQEFNDQATFERWGKKFVSVGDWRRDNISRFIRKVGDSINVVKPGIRFGISPSGVWRNKDNDVSGSNTRAGQTAFDDLYADVLLWMKQGWIDYLAPQIYWHIGFELADYQSIAGLVESTQLWPSYLHWSKCIQNQKRCRF